VPNVAQGGTYPWEVTVRDGNTNLADPATLQVEIKDPLGGPVLTADLDTGVVRDSIGLYHYDWAVSPTALLGDYSATWSGILGGAAIGGAPDLVEVVLPGSITPNDPVWTYDLSTKVGQMRLTIDDRDLSNVGDTVRPRRRSAIFTDQELQVFLDDPRSAGADGTGDYRIASALALIVIAGNRQLLVQSRRIGDTTVDFGPVRKDLLAQAAALVGGERELEILMAPPPADQIVEVGWTDFNREQIVIGASLREVVP